MHSDINAGIIAQNFLEQAGNRAIFAAFTEEEASMKTVALIISALAWVTAGAGRASEPARGDVLELYSCEVFTGGCTASSEATLEGRYAVRAWHFTRGELRGLTVATLQVANDNLAARPKSPAQTVVYLPDNATESQRAALLNWVRPAARFTTRVVPIRFSRDGLSASLSVGDFVRVNTGPLHACDRGGCGESLWYKPVSTTAFEPAMNRHSAVNEPALAFRWSDNNRRSAFIGQF
jgi:hypothetical protein